MQDFRDGEKKWPTGSHFGIFLSELCHGLSLCEKLHFVLYSWSSNFAFLELSKYYKIQNGR